MNNTWKLNRDGSLANFYRYFYAKEDLPNNGCDYFWLLCLGFILMPFVWPAVVLNTWNKKIALYESTRYNYGILNNEPFTYYSIDSSGFIQTGLGIILNMILIFTGAVTISAFYKIFPSLSMGYITSEALSFVLIYIAGIIAIAIIYYGGSFLFRILCKFGNKSPETDDEWQAYFDKERAKEAKVRAKKEYKKVHPSFFKLIIMRFLSYKEKNCPIIEWEVTKTVK